MRKNPPDPQNQLSETVALLLRATGDRQAHLAESLGCSPATVSQKLSGTRQWSFADIYALAEHFDLAAPDLISGYETAKAALPEHRHAAGRQTRIPN